MSKKQPLNNAGAIIERFGGIRPMAAKIDTPVTTVQGWKKRDVIPGTRRTQILNAASENNIDISDISELTVASVASGAGASNQNNSAPTTNLTTNKVTTKKAKSDQTKSNKTEIKKVAEEKVESSKPVSAPACVPATVASKTKNKEGEVQDHEELMAQIQMDNEKTMKSSAWITTGLILTALSAGMLLIWPQFQKNQRKIEIQNQQLATLEKELSEAKSVEGSADVKQKLLGSTIAEGLQENIQGNLQEKMDQIQNQARNISNTVEQLSQKAKEISEKRIENGTQALTERLDKLETRVKEGVANIEAPSIEGVPSEELKAAAILVAFSQFRNSLDREQPFEEDLAILQKLIGNDNPCLLYTSPSPRDQRGSRMPSSA